MRRLLCSGIAVGLFGAGSLLLAAELPNLVSLGSCSTTGRLSRTLRETDVCTADQTRTILLAIGGLLVVGLGMAFTVRPVRGRDSRLLRLFGFGVAGLAGGVPAYLRLRDPALEMAAGAREGWTTGMLPLIIGGAVCLLLWMILGARELRRTPA